MSTPTPTRKPLLTTALQGDPFLFDNTFDPTPSSQSTLSTPLSREDAIEMAYLWDFLWQKIANSGNHLFLSKQSIVFNRDNDWSFTLLKAGKRYHYEAQTQTLTHPLWLPPKAHALKYLAGF